MKLLSLFSGIGAFEKASCDEYIEVAEEKISESFDKKQSEYIFNEKKFIELLLREGIIEIKQG